MSFDLLSHIEREHIRDPPNQPATCLQSIRYGLDNVADWYGAPLTVLHVAPTFDPVQLERMRRAVERTAARETPTLVAEEGDAPTTIVDQALSLGADLIVLGTHGHRGFKRLLLGSVTEAVLHEAPCPVLTVPPGAGAAAPGPVNVQAHFVPDRLLAFSNAGIGICARPGKTG